MSDRPNDSDLIRVPAATLTALHGVLLRERGALEAAHLLRDVGLASGEAFFTLFRDSLASAADSHDPADLDSASFWSRLGDLFADLGWGQLHHEEIGQGVFSLYATDWAEGGASGGGCHLTAGLLADVLHRIAGFDLAVLEVDSDPETPAGCRFIIGSPQTLEAVFSRIQDGAPYQQAVEAVALGG